MCFSAGASFAGGAVITAIGVMTVSKNSLASRRLFAGIPLIFGLQQISEGFVWLSLQSQGHDLMLAVSSYIFLLAAVVIWPFMIPLSVLQMEVSADRRRTLRIFLAIGILTSLYYGTGLLLFDVNPQISSHHIRYASNFPRSLAFPAFIAYLVATLVPIFISGVRRMRIMGVLMAASCLITGIFYKEYLTSVWCFFAAIISVVIYWIISEKIPEDQKQILFLTTE
jgi:general stress protein CsbA